MIEATINLSITLVLIALPFILVGAAVFSWLSYRRTKWNYERVNGVLLKINLPGTIEKSPRAIELLLGAIYDTSYGTYLETFIDGRLPTEFALEIVSQSGKVDFYIWTPAKFTPAIKSVLYGQYPDIEIEETSDYLPAIQDAIDNHEMWGGDFSLRDKDVFPIQTYTEYKLEENPREENKIDPFNSLVEFLGSLGYGEQCWIQLVIRGDHTLKFKNGNRLPWNSSDTLKDRIEATVKDLKEGAEVKTKTTDPDGKQREVLVNKVFAPGVDKLIQMLSDQKDMPHFQTNLRAVYIAKNEVFRGFNIPSMIKIIQGFSSVNSNTFVPKDNTDLTDPQKDLSRTSKTARKYYAKVKDQAEKEFLTAFKRRIAFTEPHKNINHQPFVLTSQEIATLWHFPGESATTPTLNRIDSRKSDPPVNLPV